MEDVQAGSLLGFNAWLQVVFGLLGAVLTDRFGVRRTAIAALSVAVVARGILAFARSQVAVRVVLLALTPCGEALLSTGIYTVALKKLTTPDIRSFVFGVQYGVFNLSGAIADIAADVLRQRNFVIGGEIWSGLRVHVFITWLAVMAAWCVSYRFLFDVSVQDLVSPADPCSPVAVRYGAGALDDSGGESPAHFEMLEDDSGDSNEGRIAFNKGMPTRAPEDDEFPGFVVVPGVTRNSLPDRNETFSLVRSRPFWRALCLALCLLWTSKQWGDMDQLMPAFLERYYGEDVPIYTIHSINMWVCMVGPWIVAALTSHVETFRVIMPGLWIMGVSPIFLVLCPSVTSTVLWVFFMSVGEVFWSPRTSAWTAGLAPAGNEAVFLALISLKSLITSVPSTAFNGWLNARFNPNCPQCRDDVGHFCATPTTCEAVKSLVVAAAANLSDVTNLGAQPCDLGGMVCLSSTGATCSSPLLAAASASSNELVCPSTCQQCDGWHGDARDMWAAVLITSLLSPVLVMCCLPFLRRER